MFLRPLNRSEKWLFGDWDPKTFYMLSPLYLNTADTILYMAGCKEQLPPHPLMVFMCRSSRMIIKSEEKASGSPRGGGQREQFLSLQLTVIVLLVAQAWNFVIDSRVPLIVGPGRVWMENAMFVMRFAPSSDLW